MPKPSGFRPLAALVSEFGGIRLLAILEVLRERDLARAGEMGLADPL